MSQATKYIVVCVSENRDPDCLKFMNSSTALCIAHVEISGP